MEWNDENLELYQRHILVSDIGIDGQERLFNASVLVIGLGAIGSSALYYLASGGVGRIGLLGDSELTLADISSQILYQKKDVGKSKLTLAKSKLKAINPSTELKAHKESLEFSSLSKIVKNYDVVLDCTDNFAPKFLINAVCVRENKHLISGGVVDLSLQLISINPHISACYSCLYGVPKGFLENTETDCQKSSNAPTCAKSAIVGSVAGILGAMQATETIKLITQIKEVLYNTLLTLDTRNMQFRAEPIEKNKNCPICGSQK